MPSPTVVEHLCSTQADMITAEGDKSPSLSPAQSPSFKMNHQHKHQQDMHPDLDFKYTVRIVRHQYVQTDLSTSNDDVDTGDLSPEFPDDHSMNGLQQYFDAEDDFISVTAHQNKYSETDCILDIVSQPQYHMDSEYQERIIPKVSTKNTNSSFKDMAPIHDSFVEATTCSNEDGSVQHLLFTDILLSDVDKVDKIVTEPSFAVLDQIIGFFAGNPFEAQRFLDDNGTFPFYSITNPRASKRRSGVSKCASIPMSLTSRENSKFSFLSVSDATGDSGCPINYSKGSSSPSLSQKDQRQSFLSVACVPEDTMSVLKKSRRSSAYFQDPSQIFPMLRLPSAEHSYLIKDKYIRLRAQINEFFASPVPGFGPLTDNYSYGCHLCGLLMEYSLRVLIGAPIDGYFEEIVGWRGYDNPWTINVKSLLTDTTRTGHIKAVANKQDNPAKSVFVPFKNSQRIETVQEQAQALMATVKYYDAKWSDNIILKELYANKTFVSHGLYFDPPSENHSYNDMKFKFPMPINAGDMFINQNLEFDVPWDISKYVMVCGGAQHVSISFAALNSKLKQMITGPTPFINVNESRINVVIFIVDIFVDRKPNYKMSQMACNCTQPKEVTVWELDANKTKYVSTRKTIGCGEDCLNRLMFYECDQKTCPMKELCTNQRFQKRLELENLSVFKTKASGFGLKTNSFVPKGSLVIEYRGEVISQETRLERMNDMYKKLENYYFLEYASGEVIDGCRKGTVARFINHSCNPNCHIEKWSVGGEQAVGVFASQDILPETEILYDYNFHSFGAMQKCMCGAFNCRGFLGVTKKASEERENRLKSLKNAAEQVVLQRLNNRKSRNKRHTDRMQRALGTGTFEIKSTVMISSSIVYNSPRSFRAHVNRLMQAAVESKDSIMKTRLFLLRNLHLNCRMEISSLSKILRPGDPLEQEIENLKQLVKLSKRKGHRRKRSLIQIVQDIHDDCTEIDVLG